MTARLAKRYPLAIAEVRPKLRESRHRTTRSSFTGCPSPGARWTCPPGRPLPVPSRLHLVQGRVVTAEGHEVLVRPRFADAAVLQHQDVVGHAHGGEAVADQQRRLARDQLAELLK